METSKILQTTDKIDKIAKTSAADIHELLAVISDGENPDADKYLFAKADEARRKHYGKSVYLRGLIEFSSYCKNDCYYCGIRRSNKNAERYRLSGAEILKACAAGYELGFRTFVLQSGEDLYYTDNLLCGIVSDIKSNFPDTAVTLSTGEKSPESYRKLREAGADRYLLRHETADPGHYRQLHPSEMSAEARYALIRELKEIGFATGAGFMAGSPFQTAERLAGDLVFLKKLAPHMVGIGPFIPHKDTPFSTEPSGTLRDTLVSVALARLLLPKALIPATTALATLSPDGRRLGLQAGANVVMPNLTPQNLRGAYSLYDNKATLGGESAEGLDVLKKEVEAAGYELDFGIGNPCC